MAKQKKPVRRQAVEELVVYDVRTNQPIGRVENMTAEGVKLVTDEPADVSRILYCRLDLPEKLLGADQVFFDAECRWCRKNEFTGLYESGFKLRNVRADDKEIISHLTRRWMIMQSDAQNDTAIQRGQKKSNFLSRVFQSRAK